jgi:uncharacterized OB-fold protein/acyl dehydratase
LIEQLKAFEGRQIGPPEPAPDEVNQAMIRHWCEAIGDTNPVYTDPEAAAASVHGSIIAPPVMLQAWVMRGVRPRPSTGGTEQDTLMRLLDENGFSSVVATNGEQEYYRQLHLGDRLTMTSTIESISDEKKTALGTGHFVTSRLDYHDQDGELVASVLFRILKFRPAERKQEAAPKPLRPRPSITHDNAFFFEGTKQGKLLIQRCSSCGVLRHPPMPSCGKCHSLEWDTIEASGKGTVYSFVVNHYPQVPAFDYPLLVGLIELEEGTRFVSNIVGIEPDAVTIGMPVEVEFTAFDDDLTLPQFRVVSGPEARGAGPGDNG